MAEIPITVGRRSLETGSVVQYSSGDPVGAALAGAGRQAADLAEFATHRKERQERFAALMGWDTFNTNMLSEADQAKRDMKPGAVGLHDDLVGRYDTKSAEWLAQQPQHLRQEFQARIQAKRAQFSRSAAVIENEESQRFQLDGLTNGVKTAGSAILSGGPDLVDGYIRNMDERIDASTLPPVLKEEAKRKARQDLQEQGFKALLARDPKAAQSVAAGWGLGQGGVDQVVDRIIGAESGGRADAKNPNSSATGAGQFVDATWLDMVKRNRPDLAQGKTDDQILALRGNPALSREMTRAYAQENSGKLAAAGLPQTAGNIYLSHFLGPDGAAKVLKADPNTPIASLVGDKVVAANQSVLAGRTAGQVASWASARVGGGAVASATADPRFNDLTPDKRLQLAGLADVENRRMEAANATAQTAAYNARFNDLQTRIIDNQASMADVATARQEGWLTDAGDIQRLTGAIAQRDKQFADVRAFSSALATPGFVWNPVDKDHKDMVDAGFKSLGGDMSSLQTIVDRTGVMPASAAVALRGGLMSSNPTQVENSLQVARNLVMGKNPNVLLSVEGGKDLTEAALTFDHYVYSRGKSAADAAKQIMEERSPEFEQRVRAKIKKEDVDLIVKKELKDSDIRSFFDQVPFVPLTDPSLGNSVDMRKRAMGDYEEAFRDYFMRSNGDVELAKKQALQEMRVTWGVTNVTGPSAVMKFAPERSRVYAGIEDASGKFAAQAITAIKEANGVDVERKNLVIMESRGTAEKFVRGEPPTYTLGYRDKAGLVQFMPKPFFADPAAMRTAQTSERERRFNVARDAIEARQLSGEADLQNAPLGVRPY